MQNEANDKRTFSKMYWRPPKEFLNNQNLAEEEDWIEEGLELGAYYFSASPNSYSIYI